MPTSGDGPGRIARSGVDFGDGDYAWTYPASLTEMGRGNVSIAGGEDCRLAMADCGLFLSHNLKSEI